MENSSITKVFRLLKNTLLYHEPIQPSRFVLQENESDGKPSSSENSYITESLQELTNLLRYAHRLEQQLASVMAVLQQRDGFEHIVEYEKNYKSLKLQLQEIQPILMAYNQANKASPDLQVSASLEENARTIGELYRLPANTSIILHNFIIPETPPVSAMLAYMDPLCDKKYLATAVIRPLMTLPLQTKVTDFNANFIERIQKLYIPGGQSKLLKNYKEIQEGINSGKTIVFFDGSNQAIAVDTIGGEYRSVDKPTIEPTVRGPQAAFTESLSINIGLIRSFCRSSDLVAETTTIGSRSHLTSAVMYIESIANPTLVAEVRRRISSIQTDFLADSDELEQFIGDHPKSPFPTSLSTERPDHVAANLAEGRIAILLDGSPFVQVVPISFFSLIHSREDYSMKYPYGTFIRILRWLGLFISILLPATFLSISTFHIEAIPTDLLLSISGARDQVPFPTLIEILLLDTAFELLREAGLRIPGILGPTIGIVGGIILGQAIVAAKIVSPISVIVVAMTGLSSYVIPDYRLAAAVRLVRFLFIALGATFGLVGVSMGLLLAYLILGNMKSFGVPYLAPLAPKTLPGLDVITRGELYRQERRPDELQPKEMKRQPHISRGWTEGKPEGRDTE